MKDQEYLKIIIESIVQPVLALNRKQQIIATNSEARKLFCANENTVINLLLGQLLGNEKLNQDGSESTISETKTKISHLLEKVFENQGTIENQNGLFSINDIQSNLHLINFSVKYVDLLDGLALLTIHSVNKELTPKNDVNDAPNNQNEDQTKFLNNKTEFCYFALENSPFEFLIVEPSGKIIYANKLAKQTFGIAANPMPDIYINNINPNASEDWWFTNYQKLKETGMVRFETSHWNTEGFAYPVMVSLSMLEKNKNKYVCYFSYDNSEQHSIQETLLKESQVNESLAEISHELSLHNTLGSVALLVRQYALQITDSMFCFIVYEDPTSNQLVSSIYSDSSENYQEEVFKIERLIKQYHQAIISDEGELRSSYSDVLNDTTEPSIKGTSIESLIPFQKAAWTGIFFNEEYKGLLFVAGKEVDYTPVDIAHLKSLANLFGLAVNRIQEQIKLINNMEQLELALDVANMGIWNVYPADNTFSIDSRSNMLLNSAGFKIDNNLKKSEALIHPEDLEKLLIAFHDHMNSNSSFFRCDIRIKNRRNDYLWYEINGRIISRSITGKILKVTGVVIDINNIMKLNEELVRTKEEAIFANKAKSAFIARISHEIRTPLNAIIGFSDYLINKITDPVHLDYLNNIKNSGDKLVDLLTDVLDYSKIESGMMMVKIKPANIRNIVSEINKMFAYSAEKKRLEFRASISELMPDVLLLDETQLRQILINLIGNAIKFTEKGSVELFINAENVTTAEIDMVISVIDTGIGISEDFQSKIFEDFTQQEDQDNRRYGGTGLGLGIVKKLVELMGGTIILSSKTGKGSNFTVKLPKRLTAKNQNTDKPVVNINAPVSNNTLAKHTEALTIKTDCQLACKSDLRKDWEQFSYRPSFKNLPHIIEKVSSIATQFEDKTLKHLIQRMENSLATFDVEEIGKIKCEFEEYTHINE